MGAYNDELKQVRSELKKELSKLGIKNISMTGGRGSVWGWTEISKGNRKKGFQDWTQAEMDILQGEAGFNIGHPSNSISAKSHEIACALGGLRARKLKKSPAYQKIKQEYYDIAGSTYDGGTCVLGAGTIVKHKGIPIDFWKERGMSESGSWKAEQSLKEKIKAMNLEFVHEGGVMD